MSRAQSCRRTNGAMYAKSRQRWRRRSTGLSGCESGKHRQSRSVQDGYPPALGGQCLPGWAFDRR
eukprot:1334215-Pleurochrysis_carterae.AAC.1